MNQIEREPIEWCDIWMKCGAPDQTPRALVIGDSISRAMYKDADAAAGEDFVIDRLSTSRSLNDPHFFKEVDYVSRQYDYKVIHVNNGLHGWHITDDDQNYGEGMRNLLNLLKDNCPYATIIWAMTTPVTIKEKTEEFDPERNPRVLKRNEIATKVAEEYGLVVNDLYALASSDPAYGCGDGYHYNETGNKAIGEKVATAIAEQL